MRKTMHKLFGSKAGATAIEYGLIAALVSVAMIASLKILGPALDGAFSKVATEVQGATAGGGGGAPAP
jgi:pilus assembly protein Flp/PilA